jgi:hypothetical protein
MRDLQEYKSQGQPHFKKPRRPVARGIVKTIHEYPEIED